MVLLKELLIAAFQAMPDDSSSGKLNVNAKPNQRRIRILTSAKIEREDLTPERIAGFKLCKRPPGDL